LQKLEIWGWPEHLVGDVGLRLLELLRDLTLRGLWVWDSLPPKLTSFTCTTWYGVRPLPKLVKALEGVETLEDLDICFRTHSRHGIKATENLEVGYRMDWTGFEPGRIQLRLKRVRVSILLPDGAVPKTRLFQPLLYFLANCSRLEQLELRNLELCFKDVSKLCQSFSRISALNIVYPSEMWTRINPEDDGWLAFCHVFASFENFCLLSFSAQTGDSLDFGRGDGGASLEGVLWWSRNTLRKQVEPLLFPNREYVRELKLM
jgi:hypothetical protein